MLSSSFFYADPQRRRPKADGEGLAGGNLFQEHPAQDGEGDGFIGQKAGLGLGVVFSGQLGEPVVFPASAWATMPMLRMSFK